MAHGTTEPPSAPAGSPTAALVVARLVVEGLACRQGERMLFSGLGFRLAAGEIMAVTGPNGSGKTTLLRALLGFHRPQSGIITLEGADPELGIGDLAHLLGHRDGLRGALTVREQLEMAPALYGSRGASTAEAVARLRLERLLDLPVAALSAGQRRRAALARLLVAPRPLWLLDEPTAALDSASGAMVAALMRDHAMAGGMVLAATHLDLGVAARELVLAP